MVPLRRPVIASIGRFDHWPLVLIDVETHEGVVGRSYLQPYRRTALKAIVAELLEVSEQRKDQPLAPFDTWEGSARSLNVVGLAGISTIAMAGLDMAIWDAMAKAAGLPLAVYLGGSVGPVKAYNSNGLWRHAICELPDEAEALLADGGFSALKLRLGNVALKDDLASIDAVRGRTGEQIDLMVDFNQALGFGDAMRRCRDLDELGLYWIEEPILYSNIHGYAQLARKLRTPLQAGENFYGSHDLFRFLAGDAVHYAMLDLMRIGGVTGWLRSAAIADAAGVQISNHLYPEFSAHLLRVTPTAHWLEWVDWANPILAQPLVPKSGMVTPSSLPGAGIEWNEDNVRRYAIEP